MRARRLREGDAIGIVVPSKRVADDQRPFLDNAIEILEGYGLHVVLGKHAFGTDKWGVSGGSLEDRVEDINEMFRRDDVQCIWCFQGGNTATELLEHLDYDLIRENPKIFMGLSDTDVLNNAIHSRTGLVTFTFPDPKAGHPDPVYLNPEYTRSEFKRVFLEGGIGEIPKNSQWKTVRDGKATGKIAGCNLTSLLKIAGTKYFPDCRDAILVLESYRTDVPKATHQLYQLRHMGVFDQVAGIVVGHVWGFQREEHFDAMGNRACFEDVLLDATRGYSFPILKIEEVGHYCPCTAIPIGGMAAMDASKLSFRITESVLE